LYFQKKNIFKVVFCPSLQAMRSQCSAWTESNRKLTKSNTKK